MVSAKCLRSTSEEVEVDWCASASAAMMYSWSHPWPSPGQKHETSPSIDETSIPEKGTCFYCIDCEFKAGYSLKIHTHFHKIPSRPLEAIKSKKNYASPCLPPANTYSEKKTSYRSQINPLIWRRSRAHFRSRAPSRGTWPSHSLQKKPNHQQETTHIVVGLVAQRPRRVPQVSHRVH